MVTSGGQEMRHQEQGTKGIWNGEGAHPHQLPKRSGEQSELPQWDPGQSPN